MKTDLKDLDASEMEVWAAEQGLESYRARQIRQWLLGKKVSSFQEMTNLPKSLRDRLEDTADITPLEQVRSFTSEDGTRKLLFRLRDHLLIESVLIPERDHLTLCVSSQAGCAMNCRFCLTGKQGLKRNLTASEIIEQVIQVKRELDRPEALTNIVFMGMGEPLANYNAVLKAVNNLIREDGINLSHRKVTLSTCGLPPQMQRLGRDTRVNLAISLNAADDETRDFLMPVNRTYPLNQLMAACRAFPLPNRRMLTFEYILIKGINDSDGDAVKLAALLKGLRAKINLIPFNAFPESGMSPTPADRVLGFQSILIQQHYTAIIRKSKGRDIMAACGQLSGEGSAR
jgi:23S rRNA (adenine2503-C2)-methyltransferase